MTRPLRVLGIVDNLPRGIDWWRMRTPLSHLADHGCQVALCPTRELVPRMFAWADVVVSATMFYREPWQYRALRDYCTAFHKILVRDLDDDVWSIPDSNPFAHETENHEYGWRSIRESIPAIEASIENADLVTTTTNVLASRIWSRFVGKSLVVLPNCIDPKQWAFDKEAVRTVKGLTVGTAGGESHYEDWRVLAEVYPEIHRRFPSVTLVAAGFCPDYLAALGYVQHCPSVPIDEYPRLVGNLDVRLCPLGDTAFNQAKSPIALIEAGMAGALPILSQTVYTDAIPPGLNYCSHDDFDPEGWEESIELWLSLDADCRAMNAATNRRVILARFNIETQAHLWATAYRRAWEKVQ